MTNALGTQGALRAMETYFSARGQPERLRVNASGDIEIAGRFTMLFDRISDRIKSLVIAGYQPVHWQERARDAVLAKLESSLTKLLPANDPLLDQRAGHLLANISHQLERSDKISWRRALAMELDLLRSSDAGAAMSNALRLLVDIGQLGDPDLESQAIAAIGAKRIDFAVLSGDEQQAMLSALSETIARRLQDRHALPEDAAKLGADALLQAMQAYDLDLGRAMTLLDLPASLRDRDATGAEDKIGHLILEGIARSIARHTGVTPEVARKGAKNVEFCMRRYAMDWKQALDLVGLTNRLAPRLQALRATVRDEPAQDRPTKPGLGPAEMDCARAVQQVMARDGCDIDTAMQVVERRLKTLESIRPGLPPRAMPSIVEGMQFHLSANIYGDSQVYLANQIRSLDAGQQKESWRVPGSTTDIPLSENYLKDSIRSLRVALDDGQQVSYFDERNPEGLTAGIYAFAGDANTMTALCDSINQTVQASILKIILKMEQHSRDGEQLMVVPGEDRPGTSAQRLWNSITLDGKGKVIVRHVFIQKTGMLITPSSGQTWPINQGPAWDGDVSPLNAGLTYDYSYAFDLADLQKGKREPQILDCRYTIAGSLDWESIDRMPA